MRGPCHVPFEEGFHQLNFVRGEIDKSPSAVPSRAERAHLQNIVRTKPSSTKKRCVTAGVSCNVFKKQSDLHRFQISPETPVLPVFSPNKTFSFIVTQLPTTLIA